MQTFLPYADFEKTASVLDYRRLGKQRVETKQILMALNGETKGWVNHPATKMWTSYEFVLAYYGSAMSSEWKSRGYVDNLLPYFVQRMRELTADGKRYNGLPWFIGHEAFHESHRSNLLRKAPEYYSEFFSDTPSDLPYIWTPEEMSVPRVTVGV
jgi:hypothetical protein